MKKDKIARKLVKIAKELVVGYKKTTHNQPTNNLNNVDEIVIVITDQPLEFDISKFASKTRNTRYSLNEVKQLLSIKPPRFEFQIRNDNLSDPTRLNITESEALAIISNLNESDYNKNLSQNFPNTDVYTVSNYKINQTEKVIDLYIKFAIVDKGVKRRVLIISFHEKGLI